MLVLFVHFEREGYQDVIIERHCLSKLEPSHQRHEMNVNKMRSCGCILLSTAVSIA